MKSASNAETNMCINGKSDEMQSIVRQMLVRVELDRDEVRLHERLPIQPPTRNSSMPQWELEGSISHLGSV